MIASQREDSAGRAGGVDGRGALKLSQEFFDQVASPSLREAFPNDWQRMGAGLVGNGSECFGFDDELSRDHDWGVDFFLWLNDEDYDRLGNDVRAWKARLWAEHAGDPRYPFRVESAYGLAPTVVTPARFYAGLIGLPQGPQNVVEWRRVPESSLALCVNGRVFADPLGDFTRIREHIAGYYPEDLRLKKIAARCMALAQTGQYNYLRIAQRGDVVAKNIALAKFVQDAVSLVFLLNKAFMPYYKWAFRAMRDLPVLAEEVAPLLEQLYADDLGERVVYGGLDEGTVVVRDISRADRNCAVIVEKICALFVRELKRQGLSSSPSTFLARHGEEVQGKIRDQQLAKLPPQYE